MPKIKQANMDKLTAERLREVLHYDPVTGTFTWRVMLSSRGPVGREAASKVGNYLGVCIDGTKYYCHRLAWLYMTGSWPDHEVDHRKGHSNRWDNLRAATSGQNKWNRTPQVGSAAGLKGVSKSAARCRKPWEASICKDYTRTRIGYFDTPEEAHAAYVQAATELHGEFARTA
jgi:hypothetical protein